jgi:hypothetical protein
MIYLDSFLKNLKLPADPALVKEYVEQLEAISKKFKVDFITSVSLDKAELDESLQEKVVISL